MAKVTVADLMTEKVYSVGERDDLTTVLDLMDSIGVRHIPVVSGEGELLGLVSQRDLLKTGALADDNVPLSERRDWLSQSRVTEIMTRDVATASPDDDIVEAGQILLENKIGCLPVTEGTHLLGILTEADFIRHVLRQRALEEEREVA